MANEWVIDPKNPFRATYTTEDGTVHEAYREPDDTPTPMADGNTSVNPQVKTNAPSSVAERNVASIGGEDNLFAKVARQTGDYAERQIEQNGGWGISPETRKAFGGDGPIEALRPITDLPAAAADLGARALQGGAVAAAGVGGAVDALIEASGIDSITPAISEALTGDRGNKFRLGAGAMAAGEAFPAGGIEVGLTNPHVAKAASDAPWSAESPFPKDVTPAQVKQRFIERGQYITDEEANTAATYYNQGGVEAGRTMSREDAILRAGQEAGLDPETSLKAYQEDRDFQGIVHAYEEGANFPTPETVAPPRAPLNDINPAQPFDYEAYEKKSQPVDEAALEASLKQEADNFQPSKEPTPDDLFGVKVREDKPNVNVAVEAPQEAPTDTQKAHVQAIADKIYETTDGWQGSPKFNIVNSVDDIADADIRADAKSAPDAIAFYGPDGSVHIMADKIDSPDQIPAIVFHEALGHAGLDKVFGKALDDQLNRFYTHSVGGFKDKVDAWLEENPDAYKGDTNRTLRAAEEVLAEQSEAGAIDPKMVDRLTNTIKQFARRAGVNLKYSDREISTILGIAHDAVRRGGGKAAGSNGIKFIRTWHGSGADFNEFDHSKMGSGEGNQVFGWGTYLTSSKNIGKHYQKMIGGEEPSWNGVKGAWYQVRRNMEDSYNKAFPDGGIPLARDTAMDIFRDTGKKATPAEVAKKVLPENTPADIMKNAIDEITPSVEFVNSKIGNNRKGKLYEVEIPDDANLMDWNKPVGEQPRVIESLKKAGIEVLPEAEYKKLYLEKGKDQIAYYDASDELKKLTKNEAPEAELDASYEKVVATAEQARKSREAVAGKISDGWTGETLYNDLVKEHKTDKAASEFLNKHGVDGNVYDAGMLSRPDKPSGDRNYVMFNDKTPKIINKYMRKREPKLDEDGNPIEKYVGNVNLDRMTTEHDVESILNDLAEQNPLDKPRSFREVKQEARSLNLNPNKIAKGKDIGSLDARITAYRQVQADLLERVGELSQRVGENYTEADAVELNKKVAQLALVHAKVQGDVRSTARALNAMKIFTASNKSAARILKDLQENGGNMAALGDKDSMLRFARAIQQQLVNGNPQGAALLAKNVFKPYWEDYILTGRHAAMLSGLGTHYKNIMENAAMIATDLRETAPVVAPEETAARVYGLLRATFDSQTYRDTWEAFQKGHPNKAVNAKTEIEGARIPVASKFLDALNAEDTFFRHFIDNMNLYGEGVREARKQGYKGIDAFQQGTTMALTPTEEMLASAKKSADRILLVDKPTRPTQIIEQAKARQPIMTPHERVFRATAHLLFPFARVSDRIIARKLTRSPLAVFSRQFWGDIKEGGAVRRVALSRTLQGSALVGYYVWAANQGEVEGDGPGNYKKRGALEAGGYQPNSVKEDGKYVDATAVNMNINPLDLHNSVATSVASIVQAYKKGNITGDQYVSGIQKAVGATIKSLGDGSFAENLEPALGALDGIQGAGDNESKANAAVGNFAGGLASSFIPTAVRTINTAKLDTEKHDTTGDKSIGDRVKGRVMAGIPGQSDKLPVKYDYYGRPMPQGKTVLGVGNYQVVDMDPTVREIQRLERTTDKAVVTPAPTSFQKDGEKIELRGEDYAEFQRVSGYYYLEIMKKATAAGGWTSLSDADKIAVSKEALTKARDITKESLYPSKEEADVEESDTEDAGD